jgi:Family of unknown function (DUF5691)
MTRAVRRSMRTAAMLGTERVSEALLGDGDLGQIFVAIDAQHPGSAPDTRASALLSKIAAATAFQRAGRRLPTAIQSERPATGHDARPPLSRRGQRQLAKMLHEGPYAQALPEWLEAAARQGIRPPPRALPALLEAGRTQPAIRRQVLEVIGPRGLWLAAFNPLWAYASEEAKEDDAAPAPAVLEQATHAERVASLRAWRRVDAMAARNWLEGVLASERARERAALLTAMEVSLGPDDEPLLESRLDDRAKDVRAQAALLLSRLPSSALVQRMEARAAGHVVWCVHPEGVGDLAIELPRKLDDDARRDGVMEQPTRRSGKRAWWLYQILAAVPPSRWTARWKATPREIVRAGLRTDWADLLVGAWAEACFNHADLVWAEALLTEKLYHEPNLWSGIPLKRAEPLLGGWLRREATTGDLSKALYEARRIDGAWSEKFSRAVATSIRTMLERDAPMSPGRMKELVGVCARRMAPGSHEAVRDMLLRSLEPSGWTPLLQQLVELVGFRAAMLRELTAMSDRPGTGGLPADSDRPGTGGLPADSDPSKSGGRLSVAAYERGTHERTDE